MALERDYPPGTVVHAPAFTLDGVTHVIRSSGPRAMCGVPLPIAPESLVEVVSRADGCPACFDVLDAEARTRRPIRGA